MKKILTIAVLAGLFALALFAASALASATDKPPSPPGQGECEHGNSGKPCRDDPQPEHGKDCEEHGPKNGGVNEDHCKGTTTTPTETTPTETTSTETTPTTPEEPKCSDCPQPTVPTPTPSEPSPEPGTPTEPPSGTGTTPSPPGSVDKPTLEEQLEEQAQENGAGAVPSTPAPGTATASELPYTGLPLWAYVLIGLGLVGTGLALRRKTG